MRRGKVHYGRDRSAFFGRAETNPPVASPPLVRASRAFILSSVGISEETSASGHLTLYETAHAGDDLAAFSEKDLEACCAGDDQSRRRLYDSSYRVVYRIVYRMVGPSDADDVTQQVYLQLFGHLKSFVGRSTLKTWIYKVAMNESLQHLRRRTRSRMGVLMTDPADRERKAQQRIDDSEALEFALARLDPTLRSLFMLRESEGLSYAEIAEVIGVPEGTVGSRLNRARAELRCFLKDLGWGPKP